MEHAVAVNIQSAMLEILQRIQSDVAEVKRDVAEMKPDLVDVKVRLERVEDIVRKQRRDYAGMLVMMRGTAGAFDEPMLKVEEDIRLIKEQIN